MAEQIKEGEITVIQDEFGSDQTINIREGKFEVHTLLPHERESLELQLLNSGDLVFRLICSQPYEAQNPVDGTTYEKFTETSRASMIMEKWAVWRLAEWLKDNG